MNDPTIKFSVIRKANGYALRFKGTGKEVPGGNVYDSVDDAWDSAEEMMNAGTLDDMMFNCREK